MLRNIFILLQVGTCIFLAWFIATQYYMHAIDVGEQGYVSRSIVTGHLSRTSASEQQLPTPRSSKIIWENVNETPVLEITSKGEIILRGTTIATDSEVGKIMSDIYHLKQ